MVFSRNSRSGTVCSMRSDMEVARVAAWEQYVPSMSQALPYYQPKRAMRLPSLRLECRVASCYPIWSLARCCCWWQWQWLGDTILPSSPSQRPLQRVGIRLGLRAWVTGQG